MEKTNTINVDVRTAVESAKKYLFSLEDMMGEQFRDVRLEEVELSEDKEYWFITLGFYSPIPKAQKAILDLVDGEKYQREYKVFKVSTKTGQVESMKIRTV